MWLRPKRRNRGIVIVAQDQTLNMHYHQRIIMKQLIDCKCRMFCNAEEHKNILLQDAQRLHHLNTLIDIVR